MRAFRTGAPPDRCAPRAPRPPNRYGTRPCGARATPTRPDGGVDTARAHRERRGTSPEAIATSAAVDTRYPGEKIRCVRLPF
jgi:hypothetical protein